MLPKVKPSKKTIYLDYAATTYIDPQVKRAMEPFWSENYGNPSSLYKKGQEAASAVNTARKTIAGILGARPGEIIFTAGGTESINLAIFGVAREFELKNKRKGHIITSAIEHHAVLRSVEALQEEGWRASYIKVNPEGLIKLDELKTAVRPDTILISIMYANNEIGTIEPIAEIGKWLKSLNAQRTAKKLPRIYFHTDACQAAGALDLNVGRLDVDLMTVNGSKIYGPKQTGFLYVKSGVKLRPLIFGGGQENNLRSGTENVPGLVGLAEALGLAQSERPKETKRLMALREYFTNQILKKIPGALLNGPKQQGSKSARRLPSNINISISGIEGEALMLYLDSYNVCVSTGSACATTRPDPSPVILAIGHSKDQAQGSVRFTLGKKTTKAELDYVLAVMPGIVKELRRVNRLKAAWPLRTAKISRPKHKVGLP